MNKDTYYAIEERMLVSMKDSAHDYLHIYRVLGQALNIAENYPDINRDVLIAASLLHDIGREAEDKNPDLCHAVEGGKQAFHFLRNMGWEEACIHDGSEEHAPESFLKEYHFKLNRLYDRFHTPEAEVIASNRRESATRFYNDFLDEVKIGDIDMDLLLT